MAAENVGKRFNERRNVKMAKEFAQRIAKAPKILFDADTAMGGK